MKKFLLGLIAVAVTAALISGCTTVNKTAEPDGDKIIITIGNWPQPNDEMSTNMYNEFLGKMKEENPNVEVVPDHWAYDVNSFLPKAASGQLPTMFNTHFTEPAKIVGAGYAKDITGILKSWGYDRAMNKDYLNLVKFDDKYYGYPYQAYVFGIICNIKMFKEAGLVDDNGVPLFPKTFDEMAKTAQIIKERTGKAGFFMPTTNNIGGWEFCNIAWNYGVDFIKNENGKWKANFNTPECIAAVQYVKDLKWKYDAIQDDILGDRNAFWRAIASDQAAMGFDVGGNFRALIQTYGMSKDNIALGKIPAGPNGRNSLMGGSLYMFNPNATDEQVDACFKWLKIAGYSPEVTDETIRSWEERYSGEHADNLVIGCEGPPAFVDPATIAAKKSVMDKYVNVNLNMFADYMDLSDVMIRPEEEVSAQELYKVFDNILQQVFTDKNADIYEILKKANTDFQTKILDAL